jgi:hypothetical protein
MPEAYKPIDISNDPELLKLAEEVHSSQHRAFCAAMMKIWHCWYQSSQAPAQGEDRERSGSFPHLREPVPCPPSAC